MKRALFIILCLALGGVGACYAQPYMHHNADAVLIIVTVFTVFAGFLIAIITIIGDPIMIPEGSWRVAEGGRHRMEGRLVWHIVLFVFYLITIGLLFTGVILDKALDEHNALKLWIERAYLFVGISSFFFTFALPAALLEMQRARYDAETDRRRRAVGIPSDDTKASS
jgi:hypothetical protein